MENIGIQLNGLKQEANEMQLHEFLDKQEQVHDESFKVDTDEKANWALRKIKQFQEQQKENTALAEAEIEKIDAWLKSENEKLQGDIDYFTSLVAEYAIKKREDDPKFKSKKLPNGRMGFRKQQPKFHYKDDLLVESLKKSGRTDLIRVKETPDKTAVKENFVVQGDKLIDPDTGEVIEGVTIEHREEKFEVKPE